MFKKRLGCEKCIADRNEPGQIKIGYCKANLSCIMYRMKLINLKEDKA